MVHTCAGAFSSGIVSCTAVDGGAEYISRNPAFLFQMSTLFEPKSKMVGIQIAALAALSGFALAAPQNLGVTIPSSWKDKIKNVVVLVEENRSFDTFAGGLTYSSQIDGLVHHNYCNSM